MHTRSYHDEVKFGNRMYDDVGADRFYTLQNVVDTETYHIAPFVSSDAVKLVDEIRHLHLPGVDSSSIILQPLDDWSLLNQVQTTLASASAESLVHHLSRCSTITSPLKSRTSSAELMALENQYIHSSFYHLRLKCTGYVLENKSDLVRAFEDFIPRLESLYPADFAVHLKQRLLSLKLPDVGDVRVGTRHRNTRELADYVHESYFHNEDMDRRTGQRLSTYVFTVSRPRSELMCVQIETSVSEPGSTLVDVVVPVIFHMTIKGKKYSYPKYVTALRMSIAFTRVLAPTLWRVWPFGISVPSISTLDFATVMPRPLFRLGVLLVMDHVHKHGLLAARDFYAGIPSSAYDIILKRARGIASSHVQPSGDEYVRVRGASLERVYCSATRGAVRMIDKDPTETFLKHVKRRGVTSTSLFAFGDEIYADARVAFWMNTVTLMHQTARACLETYVIQKSGVTRVTFVSPTVIEDKRF